LPHARAPVTPAHARCADVPRSLRQRARSASELLVPNAAFAREERYIWRRTILSDRTFRGAAVYQNHYALVEPVSDEPRCACLLWLASLRCAFSQPPLNEVCGVRLLWGRGLRPPGPVAPALVPRSVAPSRPVPPMMGLFGGNYRGTYLQRGWLSALVALG